MAAIIFVDEDKGVDADDTLGTEAAPFSSLVQAYLRHGAESEYRVRKNDEDEYKPAAKAGLKKAANYASAQQKKRAAAANRVAADAQQDAARAAVLEQAKDLKISEDPSLPQAVLIDIGETDPKIIGQIGTSDANVKDGMLRVRIQGRVHRVAKQGGLLFVTLRRGLNMMQCLLSGNLAKTYDALTLTRETSMEITGQLWNVPAGSHAPTTFISLPRPREVMTLLPTGFLRMETLQHYLTCVIWPSVRRSLVPLCLSGPFLNLRFTPAIRS